MNAPRRRRKRKPEWFGPLQALLFGLALIVVGFALEQATITPWLTRAVSGR